MGQAEAVSHREAGCMSGVLAGCLRLGLQTSRATGGAGLNGCVTLKGS